MTDEKQNEGGIFGRLKRGLKKTSSFIKTGFSGLFNDRKHSLSDEEVENLERVLIEADLGVDLSFDIIEALEKQGECEDEDVIRNLIKDKLLGQFKDQDRTLPESDTSSPKVILFMGINGSGKTTSIAKIAHQLKQEGRSVIIAAGDTFRAAAIDQLAIWADRLNVPLLKHQMGADPAAVTHDACQSAIAKKIDYVLVDTAGRLHNQNSLMQELYKVVRVAGDRVGGTNLEKLIVLDGNAGHNSFIQAKSFKKEVGLDGVILTKLDGTAKGGVVVSVEKELNIPVKFIGVGEGLDDLMAFNPELFVEALMS